MGHSIVCQGDARAMESTRGKPDKLGILIVNFSPVVREGLQAILAQDQNIKVGRTLRMGTTLSHRSDRTAAREDPSTWY